MKTTTFHMAASTLVFLMRFNMQTTPEMAIADDVRRRVVMPCIALLPWLAAELAEGPHIPAADGVEIHVCFCKLYFYCGIYER